MTGLLSFRTITFGEMEALIDELAKKYKDDHKLDDEAAARQQIISQGTTTSWTTRSPPNSRSHRNSSKPNQKRTAPRFV